MTKFSPMEKKPLNELDTASLEGILNSWGQDQVIFQSEAQFQFNLAWKLQEAYDCEAKLEDLSVVVTREKKLKQKVYTDIVLVKGDYSVAIELKYKTAILKYKDTLLFNHGAADLGRYDFLWDVNRLELLIDPTKAAREQNIAKTGEIDVRRHCNKGFAVLLTNENDYWRQGYSDSNITIDNAFRFGESNGRLYSKTLDWRRDSHGEYTKAIKGTARGRSIVLNEAYPIQWKPYCELSQKKNNIFKYLIIEV
ncbi:MAG: hypothetical protein K5867_09990 [Bacteroidales bacterium]|nr:hypothetical protein [Bacteroidales bacterium]